MEKIYQSQGACEALHYISLCDVIYEKREDGFYHKVQMSCSFMKKHNCDRYTTCDVYLKAPERVEKEKEFLMKDINFHSL